MRRATALLAAALLLGGCAGRGLLPAPEAGEAARFFQASAMGGFSYPAMSSFSGVVEAGGEVYPFVAGVNAQSDADEKVGLFDPLGHVVMLIAGDGATITLTAGPAAGPLAPLGGKKAPAEGLSLGRILWGAPGYPVGQGEFRRAGDGGWEFSDGRQTLRTDPGRRFIAAADYKVAGRSLAVAYPGRALATPPGLLKLVVLDARIELRRDIE
ncbi:MAG TPA: hypothetical protein VGK27_10960 [Candidatus Deferrimicrobiaceae bacterium]